MYLEEYTCMKCGARVGDGKTHARWHDQLNDRSGATAAPDGESTGSAGSASGEHHGHAYAGGQHFHSHPMTAAERTDHHHEEGDSYLGVMQPRQIAILPATDGPERDTMHFHDSNPIDAAARREKMAHGDVVEAVEFFTNGDPVTPHPPKNTYTKEEAPVWQDGWDAGFNAARTSAGAEHARNLAAALRNVHDWVRKQGHCQCVHTNGREPCTSAIVLTAYDSQGSTDG